MSDIIRAIPLPQSVEYPIKHNGVKRGFDILFSLSILILTAPLFICIAIAIRIFSKGKVVYAHERIGRGGKPFRCYKFRTMYADADQKLRELLEHSPDKRKEWETFHKLKDDPRVTPIGKFLRSSSLDEFPQFWNVLKGELSVVGPRPVVRTELINHYQQRAHKILSLRPGITGLWQIAGRSDTSYETRMLLDEKYIDERSFLVDLKIISKTIPSILSSKGAY